MKDYVKWVCNRHDVYCNQKYDRTLPYSFHLEQVSKEVKRFKHLLPDSNDYFIASLAGWGHDLIEDTRITYNDIKQLGLYISFRTGNKLLTSDHNTWSELANVIYSLTDEKGRNREERHNEKYFKELSENRIGVYVKLCDIIANTKYSKFSDSNMLKKYKQEFPIVKENIYREEFKEMFDYLEKLF